MCFLYKSSRMGLSVVGASCPVTTNFPIMPSDCLRSSAFGGEY